MKGVVSGAPRRCPPRRSPRGPGPDARRAPARPVGAGRAGLLAALADPTRLATVRFLASHGESWCAQVRQEAGLELSKSTFSHHLRIMREAGLVTKRIQGARGYTQLRKEDVDRRFPGLLDSVINADNPALV